MWVFLLHLQPWDAWALAAAGCCLAGLLPIYWPAATCSHRFLPHSCCSCDKKLLELGWQEHTTWEEGLKKTVDWYLKHANREYWMHGDMELALDAHPTLQVPSFGSTAFPGIQP